MIADAMKGKLTMKKNVYKMTALLLLAFAMLVGSVSCEKNVEPEVVIADAMA